MGLMVLPPYRTNNSGNFFRNLVMETFYFRRFVYIDFKMYAFPSCLFLVNCTFLIILVILGGYICNTNVMDPSTNTKELNKEANTLQLIRL